MIKNILKKCILIITVLISTISISQNPEDYYSGEIYDFNTTYKNKGDTEPLIANKMNTNTIYRSRSNLARLPLLSNLLKKNINEVANMIIRLEYSGKVIPHSSLMMTDEYNYIESGLSSTGLIRYIYNVSGFKSNVFLRNETLDDMYDQILDSGSKLSMMAIMHPLSTLYNGALPSMNNNGSKTWTTDQNNNYMIKRPNTDIINIQSMASAGAMPYILTRDNLGSVRAGDIILVDFLNDGHIDLGGVAYTETISGGHYNGGIADKFIFMGLDKDNETGYATKDILPVTTDQKIPIATNDANKIASYNTTHTVVVVPFELMLSIMSKGAYSKSMIEESKIDESVEQDLRHTTRSLNNLETLLTNSTGSVTATVFDAYSEVYPNLLKNNVDKNTVKIDPSYKINNDHSIELTIDDVKQAIANTGNTNNSLSNYLDELTKNAITNGSHDYITDKFVKGLTLLPTILLILIFTLFVLDFMIMGLKEVKNGANGIATFLTKATDKFIRYSIIIVCLYLYPIVLKQIIYPLFLTHLPIYLTGIDGSNGITHNLTNVSDGTVIISYGKVWIEATSSVLGAVMNILKGAFLRFIFSLLKFIFWLIFNPLKAILYLLTKIFITGPMTVACVVGGLFMAINLVANVYMSGLFLILTTSVACIYFVFGTTDAFIDKVLLILQILLVTFLQFIIQIILLVIVVAALKQISPMISVYALDDMGDIIPMAVSMALIYMVIRIPTKVARSLEQAI